MTSALIRAALGAALITLGVTTVAAQQAAPADALPIACGMQTITPQAHSIAVENTARDNPELYRRMIERTRQGKRGSVRLFGAGDIEEMFFVYNPKEQRFDDVRAVLAYDGILARVWIDVADTATVKPTSAQFLAIVRALDTATGPKSYDSSKGILANDIDLFGAPPTEFEIEGKTDFLLTDIKEAIQGGYIAGFFSQQDQSPNIGSNMRNILYIDSHEGLRSTNGLLNTIAHEFQHLIHYARRRGSELFYNEGCSEVASILTGYWNRVNNGYMSNTNVDLLTWPSGTTNGSLLLATYERAMTFTHFVHEQYGENFLFELVGSAARGLARVDDALTKAGLYSDVVNAKAALRYFAVANYLQTSDEPQFGYELKVGSRKPTIAASYADSTVPANGSVRVQRYGSSYMQITGAASQTMRFSADADFRVMAMIYRNGVLEIKEMTEGQTYTFGGGAPGDKVVLAFVNLGGLLNTIEWTTNESTSSADGSVGNAGVSAISAVTPNPARDFATIHFTIADRSSITLELFDARGQSVRTLISGETIEPGAHDIALDVTGLPAGYYMASLRQGSRHSTHVVVVAE